MTDQSDMLAPPGPSSAERVALPPLVRSRDHWQTAETIIKCALGTLVGIALLAVMFAAGPK